MEIATKHIKGIPPDKEIEKREIRQKAAWYTIIKGSLYQKSPDGPLLHVCVSPKEEALILNSAHASTGGAHQAGRALIL